MSMGLGRSSYAFKRLFWKDNMGKKPAWREHHCSCTAQASETKVVIQFAHRSYFVAS